MVHRHRAILLLMGWMLLGGAVRADAATTISASVTYSGSGTSYSQPSGSLTIAGSPTPVLTLENSATSSGIQSINLGFTNPGAVQVLSGAVLNTTGGTVGYAGAGTATISGSGSTWTGSFEINVGFEGSTGTMQILDGGLVSDTNGYVGRRFGGVGTVTVSGGNARWLNDGTLWIGGTSGASNNGTGSLNIGSGGHVTAITSHVGYSSTSRGSVTVAGSDATWTTSGELYVGTNGSGTLNIVSGGIVDSGNSYIGNTGSARGTVTISGTDSLWKAANLYIGGGPASTGGSGSLNIADGGTLSVAGTLRIWDTSTLNLVTGGSINTATLDVSHGTFSMTGGTLVASRITGTSMNVDGGKLVNTGTASLTVNVNNGGLVGGNGTFAALVVNDGGAVGPGNSPGTLTSSTTTWNSGGKYVWEINTLEDFGGTAGGANGWDLWNTGTLSMNTPFTIEAHSLTATNSAGAVANWDPEMSYQWLIATSSNSAFLSVGGLVVDATSFVGAGGGTFGLLGSVGGDQLYLTFTPTAVPEPGSLMLASLAAVGFAVRWRRRREPAAS